MTTPAKVLQEGNVFLPRIVLDNLLQGVIFEANITFPFSARGESVIIRTVHFYSFKRTDGSILEIVAEVMLGGLPHKTYFYFNEKMLNCLNRAKFQILERKVD